ncbi:response regulator [Lujinxingia vulgaris]|uniref:Response regulator n=2 Tax=Lujinxingia vulgaris TaxID=2600176 RepID=A0A5C6XIT9_9DELT|nr:response regulator [Lujinxingia vulgaris]
MPASKEMWSTALYWRHPYDRSKKEAGPGESPRVFSVLEGDCMSQTVLVADDSRTIRKVVQMALKASTYDVVGVGSAREAVEAAQQRPSVILLDYYMPDGSGYDVCRALKNNAATSAIPVIMLGGGYKSFDAQMARDCGASQVVMKPFKTDDLIKAIDQAISQPAPAPPQAPVQQAAVPQAPARTFAQPDATPMPPAAPQRQPMSAGSQPRIPSATPPRTPSGSQPRIPSGSQPRIATPDVNASSRQPSPASTPMPGAASGSGVSALPMGRAEIENFIREEVKNAVRDELPGLLRNVMGEVFQQKVLPKLLQHSDDKIQETLDAQLSERITRQVRMELERLLSEE